MKAKITKPSLAKVQKDLAGFNDSLIMYVYHHLNGREEEAQSYLEEHRCEQEAYANELRLQLEECRKEIEASQQIRSDN